MQSRSDAINSLTSHRVNPRIVNVGTNLARSRGLRKTSRPDYRRFQGSRRQIVSRKKKQSYAYVNQPRKMNRSPSVAFYPLEFPWELVQEIHESLLFLCLVFKLVKHFESIRFRCLILYFLSLIKKCQHYRNLDKFMSVRIIRNKIFHSLYIY